RSAVLVRHESISALHDNEAAYEHLSTRAARDGEILWLAAWKRSWTADILRPHGGPAGSLRARQALCGPVAGSADRARGAPRAGRGLGPGPAAVSHPLPDLPPPRRVPPPPNPPP